MYIQFFRYGTCRQRRRGRANDRSEAKSSPLLAQSSVRSLGSGLLLTSTGDTRPHSSGRLGSMTRSSPPKAPVHALLEPSSSHASWHPRDSAVGIGRQRLT